jgi:hypothetical protein
MNQHKSKLLTTRIENAERVLFELECMGVKLADKPRIPLMVEALRRGRLKPDDSQYPIAVRSIIDLHQIGYSLSALKDVVPRKALIEKLKHVVNDAALTEDDTQNTIGRDTQLELYLAAICQNAGMNPVELAEPDVICSLGQKKLGVSAKRLKKESQAHARVSKAMEQISSTQMPGIVILDMTMAWMIGTHAECSLARSQTFELVSYEKASAFFEANAASLMQKAGRTGTIAIGILDNMLAVTSYGAWESKSMLTWIPLEESGSEVLSVECFFETFCGGLSST